MEHIRSVYKLYKCNFLKMIYFSAFYYDYIFQLLINPKIIKPLSWAVKITSDVYYIFEKDIFFL